MFKKSKWFLLYLILALFLLFSIFAVPKIVISVINGTKGQLVTIPTGHDN